MRARMAGVFVLGIAVGMVLLTAGLWYSGALNLPAVLAGNKLPLPAAAPASPNAPAPPIVVNPSSTPPAATVEEGSHPAAEPPTSWHHIAMPIAGLDPAKINDTFDDARDGRKHEALDIPSPRGTPVLAVDEGNVVKLFNSKPGGLTVYQFDDTQTVSYYYAHLDRYAPGLKEGTLLRKGDVLGYVGTTGNASGGAPHLHLAVNLLKPDKKWWEGTPIDPLPLLR